MLQGSAKAFGLIATVGAGALLGVLTSPSRALFIWLALAAGAAGLQKVFERLRSA